MTARPTAPVETSIPGFYLEGRAPLEESIAPGSCGREASSAAETRPEVILLAREDRLKNEAELVESVRTAGYRVDVVREVPDVARRLEAAPEQDTIVVCDLPSTLTSETDIGGYDHFLGAYWRARQRRQGRTQLVVITKRWPPGEGPGMVGYSYVVAAYLTDPVEPHMLVSFIGRVADNMDYGPPGGGIVAGWHGPRQISSRLGHTPRGSAKGDSLGASCARHSFTGKSTPPTWRPKPACSVV